MSDPVNTIRNIGPAMAREFARAGIVSAQQLRDLGADDAYGRLLAAGTRPHFIGYYALVMGLQGRPWNDCQGKEKDRLRVRFDALQTDIKATKSAEGISQQMQDDLDLLGVRL